ncbi:RNA-directed DNA polymerase from mobile element jockey [Trichonephila inaurata madagascariensis]|uniref:RNA-directed DNA polymerase from mobile element jockey n=1 Tax=Trichonephila inaurata madagascariensis TaxID=2747483 RepID=A0A8X7BY69_9ARAC|nr:RNA-directed DNA polymerase from mobile element jockey [Trichonephila inaurata madagascariensis]
MYSSTLFSKVCLPDSFLDLAAANVPSIFIGDLNAKHTSWGCSVNNSRVFDLLNAADDRASHFLNDGSSTHHSFSYNTAEALDIAPASLDVFPFYRCKKPGLWHEICSKIDARTNNSKLWSIAKSLSRERPQVEVCNTILTADGFLPKDDRATTNILGSHYKKMSRLTFNKADKYTER